MDSSLIKYVKMFGPALSGPARIVNRDVAERDVQAWKASGYQLGSINEPEPAPVVHSEAQAIAHNDGEDVHEAPKAKKKGSK